MKDYLPDIGDVLAITACECNVRIIGEKGTLIPEGFCQGYGGEGPSGLIQAIKDIGWTGTDDDAIRNEVLTGNDRCIVLYAPKFGTFEETHRRWFSSRYY